MTDADEAKSAIHEKLESVVERSRTADERLEKYFEPKVDEKQPEPTPSSNQTTDAHSESPKEETKEVEEPERTPDADLVESPEPSEEEALQNSKNPERTRAYIEKLKAQIREKEQLQKQEKEVEQPSPYNSVFDQFHPQVQSQIPSTVQTPYLNPLQKENMVNQFVDQEGNVDIAGLNKALSEANRVAYEAMLRAEEADMRIARNEETMEVKEAHAEFPEIDPGRKDKFDPVLFDLVSKRLVTQMQQSGKRERLIDAARAEKSRLEKRFGVKQSTEPKPKQERKPQGPFESGSGSTREAHAQKQYGGNIKSRALNDKTVHRDYMNDSSMDDRLRDYFKNS